MHRGSRATCASSACRCAPTSRSTSTRCSPRSSATGPRSCGSRIRTIPRARCSPSATSSASSRRRRAWSPSTRRITRSRDASFLPRVLEFPNVLVVRTLSKVGMAGVRLGYAAGHAGVDRRARQGAPAVQHQHADAGGGAGAAALRRRCSPSRRRPSGASARAWRPRWPRCAGVTRVSRARQFPARPRAGCAALVRHAEGRGHPREERATAGIRCSPTACASRSARRRRTTRSSRRCPAYA